MKRAVMTALAVTLLSGTSALAQDGRGGPLARVMREAANSQAENQRSAPPQRESRPQAQPQQRQRQQSQPQQRQPSSQSPSRGDRSSDDGRRGRDRAGQAGSQTQGQRPQGSWQGQARPGGQTSAGQERYQGQRGPDRQAQNRSGGQYDRDRRDEGGPLARTIREAMRNGSLDDSRSGWNNNNRSGWNYNDRGDQSRRPVIRPSDRRDRDRNRQRYDQRRYPHYVTPRHRYQWRGSAWRPPVGFYSFRWQWGQTLPWTWYTPDYYLNDYYAYGLPMPPIGCEWVRVGDDAILVDVFTGRVYQVVYDLFW